MGCNPSSSLRTQTQPPQEPRTVPELWTRTGLQSVRLPGPPLSPALTPPPPALKAQRENNSVTNSQHLLSSPSLGTNRAPRPQGPGGPPCPLSGCQCIPPRAHTAPPAPAGSTEKGRAAQKSSLDASPLHGTGTTDIKPLCGEGPTCRCHTLGTRAQLQGNAQQEHTAEQACSTLPSA